MLSGNHHYDLTLVLSCHPKLKLCSYPCCPPSAILFPVYGWKMTSPGNSHRWNRGYLFLVTGFFPSVMSSLMSERMPLFLSFIRPNNVPCVCNILLTHSSTREHSGIYLVAARGSAAKSMGHRYLLESLLSVLVYPLQATQLLSTMRYDFPEDHFLQKHAPH